MALAQKYAPITWECDGSNRAFSVTWPFFDTADLTVTYITQSQTPVTLKEGGDYRVRGGRDGNGMAAVGVIETTAIYEHGALIRVSRTTPITQTEAYSNGAFPAVRIERALDRAMMVLEELAHGRAATDEIRVPVGSSPVTSPVQATARQSTAEVENLIQGLIKGQADQTQAAHRDLAQSIAALRRQVDGLHAAPVATLPAIQPIDRAEPAPAPPVAPATLDEAIAQARDELEREAARYRSQVATVGKDYVYLQKQSEARAALDDPAPIAPAVHPVTGAQIVKYPHLEALVGVYVPETESREDDIRAAAAFILGKAADFKAWNARIELALGFAKRSLAEARSIDDALSIPARLDWPSFLES